MYIEVNSVEDGSVVRIVAEKSGEYVAVGGYEGLQRYAGRNAIKTKKAAFTCVNSKWEVFGQLGVVLTRAMHGQGAEEEWMGNEKIERAVEELEKASAVKKALRRCAEEKRAFEGGIVTYLEGEGVSVYFVEAFRRKGGFQLGKARDSGIVEKKDIIEINRNGSVEIDGTVHVLEDYLHPPVKQPFLVIATILGNLENRKRKNEIEKVLKKIEEAQGAKEKTVIIIRTSPNVFICRDAKYKNLSEFAKEMKKSADELGYEVEVFVLLDTEKEAERLSNFYKRITSVSDSIIYPQIYSEEAYTYRRYFENVRTLEDGDRLKMVEGNRVDLIRGCRSDKKKEMLGSSECDGISEISDGQNGLSSEMQQKGSPISPLSLLSPLPSSSLQSPPPPSLPSPSPPSPSQPYLLFLGTGAALPSITRNVSSILLSSAAGDILMDCGEDTRTQLNKVSSGYRYPFGGISAIFLTHRHADHLLGVFSVIKQANDEGNTGVVVLGDQEICGALEAFGLSCIFVHNTEDLKISQNIAKTESVSTECVTIRRNTGKTVLYIRKERDLEKEIEGTEDPAGDIKKKHKYIQNLEGPIKTCKIFIADTGDVGNGRDGGDGRDGEDKEDREDREDKEDRGQIEGMLLKNGIWLINSTARKEDAKGAVFDNTPGYTIEMCKALHIPSSYSVKFTVPAASASGTTKTFSVSYSGDTLPNKEFANLSRNCDVMVHEGTFEQKEKALSESTKHSTIDEALEIFNASGSKTLFITHVSQRYKTVQIPENAFLALDYLIYTPHSRSMSQSLLLQELQAIADE